MLIKKTRGESQAAQFTKIEDKPKNKATIASKSFDLNDPMTASQALVAATSGWTDAALCGPYTYALTFNGPSAGFSAPSTSITDGILPQLTLASTYLSG